MSEVLQCSSCGGSNQLPEGKNSMFCAFCGNAIEKIVATNVSVTKPEDNPQIKNFLELAKNAEEASNYDEAISYYNKTIEFDLKQPEAWFGKGHCSGWSGNLRVIKINEMVRNFKKALEYSNEKDKDSMSKRIVKSIDGCAFAVYNLSYNHTVEFATVNGTYQEHLRRSIDVLDSLEYAHSLNPESKHVLDSLVKISENLLSPIRYKDYSDNYGSHNMDGNSKQKVNTIRLKYTTKLAMLNPSSTKEMQKEIKSQNNNLIWGISFLVIGLILTLTGYKIFIGLVFIIGGIYMTYTSYNIKKNNKEILNEIKKGKY
jgi:tetratricopeptide (TPR) repeat protein